MDTKMATNTAIMKERAKELAKLYTGSKTFTAYVMSHKKTPTDGESVRA